MRKRLLPALMVFSVLVGAFGWGFCARHFRVFPFGIVRDAGTALVALVGATSPDEVSGLAVYRTQVTTPTAIVHDASSGSEAVLITGSPRHMTSRAPGGCLAWIVDRQGGILHEWRYPADLWQELKTVTRVPGVSGPINPAGVHLFNNGDLLVTFHGDNTFPFGVGIARVNRDSHVVWQKELLTHHCFSVAEDGRIFVPSLEVENAAVRIADTESWLESPTGTIYRDVILVLNADGEELDRIPMLEALFDSGWHGQLIRGNASRVFTDDPLHLNDVRLITEETARQNPVLKAGDLLVSFRNINTVALLDMESRRFRWLSSGTTVGQHSPRIWRGGVLVLDNLGGHHELGGTRLVRIDFATGRPDIVFPAAGRSMPDLCRTVNSGYLDVHGDSRRALVTLTHEGAVWEVDLDTGEVTWEYIYVHPGADGKRQPIGAACYVDPDAAFLSSES